MDELRHSHNLHTSSQAGRRSARSEARPSRLGQTLRDAREDKGLELRDLSVLTNVRVMHLEALEAGDFHNLPEDVYSKNFVRLYAQAVGLEPSRMLLLYNQERRATAGTSAARLPEKDLTLAPDTGATFLDDPRLNRLVRLFATLLLVVILVLAALWGFNRLLSRGSIAPTVAPPAAAPRTPAAQTAPPISADATEAATPGMVLLSVRTTPPGAEVSIDGYRFGQSPITDAPVRSGRRTVQIERAGYQPFESTLELSRNRRLNFELTPTDGALAAPTSTSNQITVTVSEDAWLEVYQGTARGEGERLVYETARPGDTFVFSAPLYVFSGNAGGVTVAHGNSAAALGSDGEVTGQTFGE